MDPFGSDAWQRSFEVAGGSIANLHMRWFIVHRDNIGVRYYSLIQEEASMACKLDCTEVETLAKKQ